MDFSNTDIDTKDMTNSIESLETSVKELQEASDDLVDLGNSLKTGDFDNQTFGAKFK